MKQLIYIFVLSFSLSCNAQEFFPAAGSASNVSKGVLALKLSNEAYQDVNQTRFSQGYGILYGISSKLEMNETFNFSNHHDYLLQQGFIVANNTNGTLTTSGYVNGKPSPFLLGTFTAGLKYRFLSLDAEQEHFRMAAYLKLSGGNEPHMVAESNLSGDNSGAATGLLATYLKHRFAISLAGGGIFPHAYVQADSNIYLHYGNALTYSLSMGYLLFPFHYKDYKQTNVNLYVEFVGESYQGMRSITENGEPVYWYNVPSLNSGHYIEARPTIQFIFSSNTRVDLSMAYLVSGESYERSYPLYFITLLHNFYL